MVVNVLDCSFSVLVTPLAMHLEAECEIMMYCKYVLQESDWRG